MFVKCGHHFLPHLFFNIIMHPSGEGHRCEGKMGRPFLFKYITSGFEAVCLAFWIPNTNDNNTNTTIIITIIIIIIDMIIILIVISVITMLTILTIVLKLCVLHSGSHYRGPSSRRWACAPVSVKLGKLNELYFDNSSNININLQTIITLENSLGNAHTDISTINDIILDHNMVYHIMDYHIIL